MVYNASYYIANRFKIKAKYTCRAAQKKRRALMHAQLLHYMGNVDASGSRKAIAIRGFIKTPPNPLIERKNTIIYF